MTVEIAIAHRFGDFGLDVEFEVDRPGITALFGPSGSGKTTTIDAVAGLLTPDRGRIAVNGDTLLDTERGVRVPPRNVGMCTIPVPATASAPGVHAPASTGAPHRGWVPPG